MKLSDLIEKYGELIRFVIVGVIATLIQYGVYYMLMNLIGASVALTVGFVVSLGCNFLLTSYFTFKVKPNSKKASGFVFSHIINWLMQLGTLNFFIWVGVPEVWAPIPMYMVCMPVNFLLVRFFVKKKGN